MGLALSKECSYKKVVNVSDITGSMETEYKLHLEIFSSFSKRELNIKIKF